VTNTNDGGPGSLRQALSDIMDGGTISFAVTGTITLTSGELLIDKNITISGPGAQSLAVDGNDNSPLFHIASGQTVTISGLTITNGRALGSDGAVYTDNATTLTLSNCTISNNSAATAIYNQGDMQISYSIVSGNGAGISNDAHKSGSATIELNYSSIIGNGTGVQSVACGHSGCAQASVTVENCTISGNSGGGGIYGDAFSQLTISNSTISNNDGGAVYNNQACVINNSTLAEDSGYDIHNVGYVVAIRNTVLKIGPSGQTIVNLGGDIKSLGYSLSIDDGGGYLNGPGDQTYTDPLLGPLQDNGGPTLTHFRCPTVRRLTRAIQTLPRRRCATSAAFAFITYLVAASTSVPLRHNRNHAVQLQHHGQLRIEKSRGRLGRLPNAFCQHVQQAPRDVKCFHLSPLVCATVETVLRAS